MTTGRHRWVLFVLGWTGLSLMFVPEVYLYFLYRAEPIPWVHTIALALANAGIAIMFLPPIVWLTRRVPVEHASWRRALAIHVPACLAFALSHSGLYALLCYASPPLFHALFVRFHPNLLTYWAIVGFTQALDYFDRYKDRERKLAQAELLLTKSQLQPHFLFNTLHTIAAMMREDVAAAERMIVQLGDLLRVLLEHVGAHEVPLATELDFVTGYTEIQKMRHVGRLDLDVHVDPELLDALVPNMLLQPLVENAIRHGLSNARNDMLTITISAHRMGADVALSVADNGRGPAREVRDGIGLATTRARLRELYGERACVELHARQPAGCAATVILPHHIHTSVELRRGGPVCPPGADEISSGVYGDTNGDRGRRALGEKALTHPA